MIIVVPGRIPHLYSDQPPIQTNIRPTPLDEMFLQFESQVVARINFLTEVCTSNANLSEVCTLCNNFRRWIDFKSRELEFIFLRDSQRNFHAKFFGIVELYFRRFLQHLFSLHLKWKFLLLLKKL